jgi:hypothetical protein
VYNGLGYFNDTIIGAYLTLVEATIPDVLKVANPWATVQLISRRYDEVLRALRYNSTRRAAGKFGDHRWLFFIFNIMRNGEGFHWTSIGIDTMERRYTYYDYAKINHE